MRLTDNELVAVIHLAKAMAAADGKVESIELLAVILKKLYGAWCLYYVVCPQ